MEKSLKLQKNCRTIAEYRTAFDAAEDNATLTKYFGSNAANVQSFLRKNAFGLCIIGTKVTLGHGLRYVMA